jgi:hypothetical protein
MLRVLFTINLFQNKEVYVKILLHLRDAVRRMSREMGMKQPGSPA